MRQRNEERRDPFAGLGSGEPVQDLGLTSVPTALTRRPSTNGRQTPIRPSEKRRRKRQLTVTFSSENADVPQRLRDLAERWGMYGPDGRRPNTSALVEYLLMPHLEAAERGELNPPGGVE